MKKIIRINPLTDPAWDTFVHQHPHGAHVHLSNWQRAVEHTFPHMRGYGLAVVDESGRILAGLPIYHVKSWLTGDRLVSIPFANFSDPLVNSNEEWQMVLQAAKDLAGELQVERIELKLRKTGSLPEIGSWQKSVNYQTHAIQLNQPIESLFKQFHKSCVQRQIRKTQAAGLTFRVGRDEQDWRSFYEIYLSHRRHRGLPPQPFAFFKALYENLAGTLQLFLAETEGAIVGGMYVFTFGQTMLADTLATRDDLKELNLPIFLYWQALRIAYDQGCKEFNFGRTSVANTSLADHKRKWATEVEDLIDLQYQSRGRQKPKRREESILYKSARLMLSNAPFPAFQMLGKAAYRHIG